MSHFIPYGRQSISQDDITAVEHVLRSDFITRGPKVEEFEQAIADYCGAKYAVAFPNGTLALMAACYVAEVGPYDRLLTTPNTYIATAGAGMSRGATPVFIDIDRKTGNLDIDALGYALEYQATRGKNVVVPVHFSGISVDMKRLGRVILDSRTVVIEDAAHALGSQHPSGEMVGSCAYSDMTMFSFHPLKNITSGEGGMITTNDDHFYHYLKTYRNNGIVKGPGDAPWYYEVQDITANYHITDMQAALGMSQLCRIDSFIEKRRKLVRRYRERLDDLSHITLFTDEFDCVTALHLFVVQIDYEAYGTTREIVMNQLREKQIVTQVHYIPLYRHPVISNLSGDLTGYFPEMETYYAQALSLPLFYDLSEEQQDLVIDTFLDILKTNL